jgi:hypothetical protein
VFEPAEIWTEYLEPEYRVAAGSAFYFSQGSDGLCTAILNGRPAPAIDSSRLYLQLSGYVAGSRWREVESSTRDPAGPSKSPAR